MNDVPIRLLRETLQARMPTLPSQECLDADTVAAWADDTLGPDDRQAAEAHAADCARCQALVAAMAKTTPPTAARSWWRAPVIGWLMPVTAVAAVFLVWMNVPRKALVPSTTVPSREIRPESPRPAQDDVSSTRTPTSVPPPTRQEAKVNGDRKTNAARARDSEPHAASTNKTAAQAYAPSDAASGAAALAPPALPAPAVAESAPLQRSAAESVAVSAPPEAVRRSMAAPLAAAKAPALMLDARRLPTLIVSSDPDTRWRIMVNGAVQRSIDSGSTWETQSTGVTVMLAAGASPSPSICWLVGPEGIVLLSTDGHSWRRIGFPEAADLASVRATDDKSATVGTTDGRAFSTTDGGQTWTRTPAR
jgi:hypothetical protein